MSINMLQENENKPQSCSEAKRKSKGKSCLGAIAIFVFVTIALSMIATCDENVSSSESEETVAEVPAKINSNDGSKWEESESIDQMTDTKNVWKTIMSDNEFDFDFPYQGGSSLKITVRYMQKYGTDVILTITNGQLLPSEYNVSQRISVRFDDDEPIKFHTKHPSDGSTETLFIQNASKFINRAKTAKSIKIQVPVFQEGNPIFTFEIAEPLTWDY